MPQKEMMTKKAASRIQKAGGNTKKGTFEARVQSVVDKKISKEDKGPKK